MCSFVSDIHAAMAARTLSSGAGPFFFLSTIEFGEPRYRGKPTGSIDITAAMAQAGDMQIELVCQNDEQPSFWRDVVTAGQSGLHHMALYCQNYDADLAAYTAAGIEVAFSGLMMEIGRAHV